MASIISASTTSGTALNMSADTTGVLQLATGATPTTAVTIDTSQNVGIGTTSPANFLDISKTQNAETNIGLSNTSTGADAQVRTKYTTNSGLFTVGTTGTAHPYGGDAYIYQVANKGIRFATNDTERMRIDSSGNLLVNATQTTPTASNASVIYGGADAGIMYMWRASGTNDQIRFYVNATKVGNITTTTTATTYNSGSDYRLKDNIVPMTNALDKVLQLKPVTFTWKADNSDGQGFIAHELQDIIPSAVTGKKDAIDAEGNPEYQGVDPSKIVATLTAAIKEQQTLIVSQSELINSLTARVTALEAK